jgi:hypothetical protein
MTGEAGTVDDGGGHGDGQNGVDDSDDTNGDDHGADSDAADTQATGREALLDALEVSRYGKLGVAFGFVFAVALTVFFVVVLAGGQTTQPAPYYLGLSFVVFVSVSMLSVGVLTGRRALHLAVAPASIVRRSATGGLLGGLCWLGGAAALATGAPGLAGSLLPWAPLLSLFGVWAVHTRYKRTTPVRPLAAAGALVAVPGALVVADLVALNLPALLAADGPVEVASKQRLFLVGAGLLGGGHALQALTALLGDGDWQVPVLLGVAPLAGLAGFLALGGPVALAVLAAGFGLAWLPVNWWLRGVSDAEVPAGTPDVAA